MYSYRNLFLLLAGLSGSATPLAAQTTDLPTEAVEIIKNFDARLEDAEKVTIPPAALETDTSKERLSYYVESKVPRLEYDPPRLRPLAFKREILQNQYKGFVKAGYGAPRSPWIEAGYGFQYEDQFDAHIGFLHHSAESTKLENQRFARTAFQLDGNAHLQDKFSVNGKVGFDQDIVSFYGYDHTDTTFNESATKQRFNRFSLGGQVYNTKPNNLDVDYQAGADFYSLTDFFDAKETGLHLHLSLTKWFADSHPLKIEIGNQLTAFSDSISKNLNNFYVKPSFTYHADQFRIRGGFNLVSIADGFKLLPNLEALYSLAGNALAIYTGWQGDYHQNTFDQLRQYNPFIVSAYDPRESIYRDIYGGVKGAASGWNYQAQVGFKKTEDLAMFLTDDLDTRRFRILYDTVNIVYISASAGIELWPGLQVSGTVLQNIYDPKNEESAWHLPGLEAFFGARYTLLENRLLLRGDGYLASGVSFINEDSNKDRLGSLVDLSFSAHYQVIEKAWLWFQVNNLNNNQRERWYRYPSFGINVLGGILFRF
ncbi:MAG: hypothetical protein R2787_12630 [Saprospiraceae bacterium]